MRGLALVLLFAGALWAQDTITLERTVCFGSCPAYTVEISSDGSVVYEGKSSVVVSGRHTAAVAKEQAQEAIREFERIGFFELPGFYKAYLSDGPSDIFTLKIGGRSKTVRNEGTGPRALSDLAARIDVLAGVERWVRGNRETVPSLRNEGFDFKSVAAGAMLARAAK